MSEATPDSTAPVADNVEHAVEIDSASTKTCTGPSAADLDLQQSTVPQNMEGGAEVEATDNPEADGQDQPQRSSSELENTAEDGGASSSTVKGETLTEEAQSSTDVDVEQKRSMDDTAATAVHTDTVDQQGQEQSKAAEDIGASSSVSREGVEKLSADMEQKCSTDETAAGAHDQRGEADRVIPAERKDAAAPTAQESDESDKVEIMETSGNKDTAEDPEVTFKKRVEHGIDKADVDSKPGLQEENKNSQDTTTKDKAACCTA